MPRVTFKCVFSIILLTINNVKPDKLKFYDEIKRYWANNVSATYYDVFGVFHESVYEADIVGSREFLDQFHRHAMVPPPGSDRALDCGAGIGRVTKNLLLERFNTIDLLEQSPWYLDIARKTINSTKLGILYPASLQDFVPEKTYDVVWLQLVLQYLQDDDISALLERLGASLNRNGVIIVKEDISLGKDKLHLSVEYSIKRSEKVFKRLFEEAKLNLIYSARQHPVGLHPGYPVYMFALKPNVTLK